MNTKKGKLCGLFCLVLCLLFAGCTSTPAKSDPDDEYGCSTDDGACEPDVKDPDQEDLSEKFKEISFDEATAFFQEGKTGLLYFGFPDCPWCRDVIPVLEQEAEEAGQEVLYIRTRDDNKERLYTDEQKEKIIPYLEEYMSENDDGELTLYVPLVVSVENGEATAGNVGTVEGHDAHEREMTEEEQKELQEILHNIVNRAASAS